MEQQHLLHNTKLAFNDSYRGSGAHVIEEAHRRSRSAPPEAEVKQINISKETNLIECIMMIATETQPDESSTRRSSSQSETLNTPTIVDHFFDTSFVTEPEEGGREASKQMEDCSEEQNRINNPKLTGRRASSYICDEFEYQESQNNNVGDVDVDLNQYFQSSDLAFDSSEYSNFGDSTNFHFSDFNSTLNSLQHNNEEKVYIHPEQQVAEKENNNNNNNNNNGWSSNSIPQADNINTYHEQEKQHHSTEYYVHTQHEPLPVASNNHMMQTFHDELSCQQTKLGQEIANKSLPEQHIVTDSNCIATATSGSTIHYKVCDSNFPSQQNDLNNNTISAYEQGYVNSYDQSYVSHYPSGQHLNHESHYDETYAPKYSYEEQPMEYANNSDSGYASFTPISSYQQQQQQQQTTGYYQQTPREEQINNQYQQQSTDGNGNYLDLDAGKTYHLLGKPNQPKQNSASYPPVTYHEAYKQQTYGPTELLQQDQQQQQPTATVGQYYAGYNSNQPTYPNHSIPVVSKLYDPTVAISGLITGPSRANRAEEDPSENGEEEEEDEIGEEEEEEEEDEEENDQSHSTPSTSNRRVCRNWNPSSQKGCRPETLERLRAFITRRMLRRPQTSKVPSSSTYYNHNQDALAGPSNSSDKQVSSSSPYQYSSNSSAGHYKRTNGCEPFEVGDRNCSSTVSRVTVSTNPRNGSRPSMTIRAIPARRKSVQRQVVGDVVSKHENPSRVSAPVGQRRSSVLMISSSGSRLQSNLVDGDENSKGSVIIKDGKEEQQQQSENELQLRSRRIIMATRHTHSRNSIRSSSTSSTCSSSDFTPSGPEGSESPTAMSQSESNQGLRLEDNGDQPSSSGVQTRSSKRRRHQDHLSPRSPSLESTRAPWSRGS